MIKILMQPSWWVASPTSDKPTSALGIVDFSSHTHTEGVFENDWAHRHNQNHVGFILYI